MAAHPLDIGTTYGRQVAHPDDTIRQRERDAWREELGEVIERGTQAHEGAAEFAESFDAALEQAGAVDVAQRRTDLVNAAIASTLAEAGRKVEAASRTSEQRMASAFRGRDRGSRNGSRQYLRCR